MTMGQHKEGFTLTGRKMGWLSSTQKNLRFYTKINDSIDAGYLPGTRFTGKILRPSNNLRIQKTNASAKKVHGVGTVSRQRQQARYNIPQSNGRVERFDKTPVPYDILINGDIVVYTPPYFEFHEGPYGKRRGDSDGHTATTTTAATDVSGARRRVGKTHQVGLIEDRSQSPGFADTKAPAPQARERSKAPSRSS